MSNGTAEKKTHLFYAMSKQHGETYYLTDEDGKRIPRTDSQTNQPLRLDRKILFEKETIPFQADSAWGKGEPNRCILILDESHEHFKDIMTSLKDSLAEGKIYDVDGYNKIVNPAAHAASVAKRRVQAELNEEKTKNAAMSDQMAEMKTRLQALEGKSRGKKVKENVSA